MVRIPWNVIVWSPHKDVRIGNNVQFSPYCLVQTDAQFGNDVLIGDHVCFTVKDGHRYDVVGETIFHSPRGDAYKVIVEDDVLIGHGSTILSGVTIGRGSLVGAGSVVSKDIPRYSIVAGNPARVVKMRFTEEQIKEHERILGYTD